MNSKNECVSELVGPANMFCLALPLIGQNWITSPFPEQITNPGRESPVGNRPPHVSQLHKLHSERRVGRMWQGPRATTTDRPLVMGSAQQSVPTNCVLILPIGYFLSLKGRAVAHSLSSLSPKLQVRYHLRRSTTLGPQIRRRLREGQTHQQTHFQNLDKKLYWADIQSILLNRN